MNGIKYIQTRKKINEAIFFNTKERGNLKIVLLIYVMRERNLLVFMK